MAKTVETVLGEWHSLECGKHHQQKTQKLAGCTCDRVLGVPLESSR